MSEEDDEDEDDTTAAVISPATATAGATATTGDGSREDNVMLATGERKSRLRSDPDDPKPWSLCVESVGVPVSTEARARRARSTAPAAREAKDGLWRGKRPGKGRKGPGEEGGREEGGRGEGGRGVGEGGGVERGY